MVTRGKCVPELDGLLVSAGQAPDERLISDRREGGE